MIGALSVLVTATPPRIELTSFLTSRGEQFVGLESVLTIVSFSSESHPPEAQVEP